MCAVRQNLLEIDNPEGPREDPLSQVREEVPLAEPRGHRGGEPPLGVGFAPPRPLPHNGHRPHHHVTAMRATMAVSDGGQRGPKPTGGWRPRLWSDV